MTSQDKPSQDKQGSENKSVLTDKEKFSEDKVAHMGNKPEEQQQGDDLSKTGQGQGQSKGKPQVQPQE